MIKWIKKEIFLKSFRQIWHVKLIILELKIKHSKEKLLLFIHINLNAFLNIEKCQYLTYFCHNFLDVWIFKMKIQRQTQLTFSKPPIFMLDVLRLKKQLRLAKQPYLAKKSYKAVTVKKSYWYFLNKMILLHGWGLTTCNYL